jgi:hypothetical protein
MEPLLTRRQNRRAALKYPPRLPPLPQYVVIIPYPYYTLGASLLAIFLRPPPALLPPSPRPLPSPILGRGDPPPRSRVWGGGV